MSPRGSTRSLGWSLTRPCVFHMSWAEERGRDNHLRCFACGGWPEPGGDDYHYDVEIDLHITPGCGSIIPRGEYAPIDPPEPPEVDIQGVRFAGSDTRFPWDLTQEETEAVERAALEGEW